jgi:hypothetical protein
MVTDKPGSEGAARTGTGLNDEHRQHKGLNNRAKNAHLPTLRRKRIMKWIMKRFRSARHLKRLVFVHDEVAKLHNCLRHAMSSSGDRALRSGAIIVWREIAEPGIAAQRQGDGARGRRQRKAPRLRTAAGRQVDSACAVHRSHQISCAMAGCAILGTQGCRT